MQYSLNPFKLGDIYREDVDKLCDFLTPFGDIVYDGRSQNVLVRNIHEKYLPNVFKLIQSLSDNLSLKPEFLSNMVNCTGAQTCKLGICLPRGLSDAIQDKLSESDLPLDTEYVSTKHVRVSNRVECIILLILDFLGKLVVKMVFFFHRTMY